MNEISPRLKKIPIGAIPFLKKNLRRINSIGIRNLTVAQNHFKLFFTLHRTSDDLSPFYKSETLENRNVVFALQSPDWSHLHFPRNVQSVKEFVFRLWIDSNGENQLFLEYQVRLDNFMLPDSEDEMTSILTNNLWIEMFGCSFSDVEQDSFDENFLREPIGSKKEKRSTKNNVLDSRIYSKPSLNRIIDVVGWINGNQESSLTHRKAVEKFFARKSLENFLQTKKNKEIRLSRIEILREQLENQRKLLEKIRAENSRRAASIEARRSKNENLRDEFHQTISRRRSTGENVENSKKNLENLKKIINLRQRTLLAEISRTFYPIVEKEKNEFSIGGLSIPDLNDRIYETTLKQQIRNINAAFSSCAHFVFLCSKILDLPLRFPVEFNGSVRVRIFDPNSSSKFLLDANPKNYDFQNALNRLNSNIFQLIDFFGLPHAKLQLRRTLYNLKILTGQFFALSQQSFVQPSPERFDASSDSYLLENEFSTSVDEETPRLAMQSSINKIF